MKLTPRGYEKVLGLLKKGVCIPNPESLDIGDDVEGDHISGDGVTIYPGCRIYGAQTVICGGAQIGYEGPATIDDCQIGPGVELKGGYFTRSVFLAGSSMGLGAQVREGCILEEEASGAHCVGLKQTILFPFVTLGSLINFCDCLMAGGTSRKHHSEVGSSYIHFNFTPEGDKTTPSLLGDVPRGVMLNRAPIFLGGQGGLVGPLRMGYGNVVAAGSILRNDYPEENTLIVGKAYHGGVRTLAVGAYPGFSRIVRNNLHYLANLVALGEWYVGVRRLFLERQEFGGLIFQGLLEVLARAKKERLKRLRMMAEKAANETGIGAPTPEVEVRKTLVERFGEVEGLFLKPAVESNSRLRDSFVGHLVEASDDGRAGYIDTVKGLSSAQSTEGVTWLDHIVSSLYGQACSVVPALSRAQSN